MGMGCSSNYVDAINEAKVKQICPKEFQSFIDSLGDNTLDQVAREATCEDISNSKIRKSYSALVKAFEKKTKLELYLAYHDCDDGDIYDDIDGRYWGVDGMYQLTPAGKKMNKYIKRQTFVNFG